jgi:hypothetical protein
LADALALLTERLEIRLPREEDRGRFVELSTSDEFMVFAGVLGEIGANARFDAMLVRAHEVSFAKQPVIERASGVIIAKLGFIFWKQDWITGQLTNLYRLALP